MSAPISAWHRAGLDPDTRDKINLMLIYQSDEKIARHVDVSVAVVASLRQARTRGKPARPVCTYPAYRGERIDEAADRWMQKARQAGERLGAATARLTA